MEHIATFTVPGRPRGKERPRMGRNGKFYTPKRTREYEELVAWCARAAYREDPTTLPVRLNLIIRSSKSRADTSNILKAVEDGMNGIIYVDDKQIEEIHISRIKEGNEGVDVAVFLLKDDNDG
jgi:crossover junction endodeoxyribonuclease RusA